MPVAGWRRAMSGRGWSIVVGRAAVSRPRPRRRPVVVAEVKVGWWRRRRAASEVTVGDGSGGGWWKETRFRGWRED